MQITTDANVDHVPTIITTKDNILQFAEPSPNSSDPTIIFGSHSGINFVHNQGFSGYAFTFSGGSGRYPTVSGCGYSSYAGQATAGTFTSGTSGTCTVTITPEDSSQIVNNWLCFGQDITSGHLAPLYQVGLSGSAVTLSGTTTSGDTVAYFCFGT